ncbi:uncharacterized protein [Branchiostoma lanceolatum]|uniref:uncharacterized protein n=1 Tax=Branchiostoma lanceolatum TaxID=7740 RepID=UPI0034524268
MSAPDFGNLLMLTECDVEYAGTSTKAPPAYRSMGTQTDGVVPTSTIYVPDKVTQPGRGIDSPWMDRPTPKIQIENENGVLQIRYPIGDNVFVTVGRFNGKALLSVRQFYQPQPEEPNVWRACKRGLALSPEQWWALKRVMPSMASALLECTLASLPYNATKVDPRRYDLGNLRYAIVEIFRGEPVVALREFFKPCPDSDPSRILPGKKGINLTPQQWQTIENIEDKVEIALQIVLEDKSFLTSDLMAKLSSD